ncbi:MAG: ATP-binding cassette domain-containing protein [Sphaerochaetaceae bacterium]|nr:ATP-binding cassette domain-containing protein [Sphaerochaetaceae bacterium]
MLDLEHVTKVFEPGTVNEKLALEDINLHVDKGDVICLIGSNGSGKSTLFNSISGSFPVTAGKITLDGKDITKMPEYKRSFQIGRIFQDPTRGTSGSMSIQDNMMLSMSKGMKGLKYSMSKENLKLFKELVKPIGLSDRLKDNVGLLSGGQRQALTLIMVCMSKPNLLLLDEHTAALDPKNAQVVMNLTDEYIKKLGLTCIMVTHNMQFAIEFGNRLIMMDEGKIILDVKGEEKRKLSVPDLVMEFRRKRGKSFASDQGLLV